MLVAICGIDGSGKTRLARHLARCVGGLYRKQKIGIEFSAAMARHEITNADGLSPFVGQQLAEAYARDFVAYAHRYGDRGDHSERIVFLDRWTPCVRAFAEVFAQAPELACAPLRNIAMPSLTIVLDLEPEIAFERILARAPPDWDETPATLSRLRDAYLAGKGDQPTRVVEAGRTWKAVSQEALTIVSVLSGRVKSLRMT